MEKQQKLTNANAGKILEIAWVLFQKKGYRGVSMDELCQQCEITKPTLYYYFTDKEDLFVQVLVHRLEGLRPAFQQEGSIEDRLTGIASCLLENFQTEYTGLVHDREHIRSEESRSRIRNAFRSEMFDPTTDLMATGIKEGRFNDDDPHSLTLFFFGIINNFIGKANELKTTNPRLAKKLTNYFLQGVSKRE